MSLRRRLARIEARAPSQLWARIAAMTDEELEALSVQDDEEDDDDDANPPPQTSKPEVERV